MDELNIYSRIENDDFEFKIMDINKIDTLSILTGGNPGSVSVMLEIYKTYQEEEICVFINKIWKKQIIGPRLWYIYKNEAKFDINNLVNLNVSKFTNDYFYEKFEKYTTNI